MQEDKIYALIGKEISGQASREEIADLDAWRSSSSENLNTYLQIKNIWSDTKLEGLNSGHAYRKVFEKIENKGGFRSSRNENGSTMLKWLFRVAAIIILVVSFLVFQSEFKEEELIEIPEISTIIKSNPAGQKSKVHLPDGSIVWLNAESELRYPEKFDSLARQVSLSGEAFFEVARDTNRAFSVTTGAITTTALGTSFNINAYQERNTIQVVLVSGNISIKTSEDDEQYLEPGRGLVYKKDDYSIEVGNYDISLLTAWKDGVLIFEEDDFPGIVAKLERWYGVSITSVGEPLKSIAYSGKFTNEYLNNVLESMSFGRPFTYEIEDKHVTLKFNN